MEKLVDIDDVVNVISQHHFDEDKNNFNLLLHNLCKEVKKIPVYPNTRNEIIEECIQEIKHCFYHNDVKNILEFLNSLKCRETDGNFHPEFLDENFTTILLKSAKNADECLDYAKSHSMNVLYKDRNAPETEEIKTAFIDAGFNFTDNYTDGKFKGCIFTISR